MPIETYQDPTTGLIIQRVVGDLVARELIALQRRLYVQARLDPAAPVLWDTRGAAADRAFARAVHLADRDCELQASMAGGKTAIVASSDAAVVPLAVRRLRETRVFTSYREAVEWLVGEACIADEAR